MILYNENKLIKAKIEKRTSGVLFRKSKTKFRMYLLEFRLVVIGFTMFSLWFTALFSIQVLRACIRWPIEELFFIAFPQCHWVQLKNSLVNRAPKSKQVKGKQWHTNYNGYIPMKILTRRFRQLVKVIRLALFNNYSKKALLMWTWVINNQRGT